MREKFNHLYLDNELDKQFEARKLTLIFHRLKMSG